MPSSRVMMDLGHRNSRIASIQKVSSVGDEGSHIPSLILIHVNTDRRTGLFIHL